MSADLWTTRTRAVSQAIHQRDRAARAVDHAETVLRQREAEFVTETDNTRRAIADLHADFPELLELAGAPPGQGYWPGALPTDLALREACRRHHPDAPCRPGDNPPAAR